MRLLATPAITLVLMAIAPNAFAQSTLPSSGGHAAQLMNAAFDLGNPADGLGPNAINLQLPVSYSLKTANYDLRLTPHAALGVGDAGRSVEAGAVLTFGLGHADTSLTGTLDRLGIRETATSGAAARWYMFAAASGRALRFNMQHDPSQRWDNTWSQDRSSALVGDAQLGLGWRRGDLQTSVGLIHRTVKGAHMLWGQETKDDSVLAFSFSVKPQR